MGRIRVGAICRDGTESKATGRGACSHHGGVREWKYEYVPDSPSTPSFPWNSLPTNPTRSSW